MTEREKEGKRCADKPKVTTAQTIFGFLSVGVVNDMLIELKWKGEIKGYGDNYKVLKRYGITQPELLELTGEKRFKRKSSDHKPAEAVQYVNRVGGSRKFKEFLSSKPLDKYIPKKK